MVSRMYSYLILIKKDSYLQWPKLTGAEEYDCISEEL